MRDDDSNREVLAEMIKPRQFSGGYKPFKPVGCVECRMTGFLGRMGLYEMLTVSEALAQGHQRPQHRKPAPPGHC